MKGIYYYFHSESKCTTSLKRISRKLMEHFILFEFFSSFVFKSMHCCRSVVLKVTSRNQQGKQHIWELFKNANSHPKSTEPQTLGMESSTHALTSPAGDADAC